MNSKDRYLQDESMKAEYEGGATLQTLADKYGFKSPAGVAHRLKAYGVKTRPAGRRPKE